MITRFFRGGTRAVLGLMAVGLLAGCTDLDENPFSAITPTNFYNNDEEVRSGVGAVYNSLNSVATGNYHYINSISSDEQVIPTRGQDWYDNGAHLEAQYQTWSPTSPSGLGSVNSAWNTSYQGVARANLLLEAMEPLPIADKEQITAEVRVLRAWFYYTLMDLFGGVPIVTTTEITPRERPSRAEVFAFVEQELTESRGALPVTRPATEYGRVTQGTVDAILASLYLNAEVFTGTVTTGGLERGTARWEDAYAAAGRVISGPYSLASDWFANFRGDNHTSPEIVFVSARIPTSGAGVDFISDRIHYNMYDPSPYNGRAAEPPTYERFDDADLRKSIFLVGPQVHLVTGAPVNDRTGSRLNFTVEFNDITQAAEGEGARVYKWPVDPNAEQRNHGNDFPIFRVAEMYLIKAEAANEMGRTGEAIQLINTIRERVFDPDQPLSGALSQSAVREAILDERLFELMDEAKRRADLIRHDRWTEAWYEKEQREPYRVLMPIPQTQLDANPMLVQNPGY